MSVYYELGVKLGAAGRRTVSTKLRTKKDEKKQHKALHQAVGNQQEPYRYGQRVKRK